VRGRERDIVREREKEKDRERERVSERERKRHSEGERERERLRQRVREGERGGGGGEGERERERGREKNCHRLDPPPPRVEGRPAPSRRGLLLGPPRGAWSIEIKSDLIPHFVWGLFRV
jgi:hypothetical protein